MKRKIIVACGGAVATSTMAAEEIKELCEAHHIELDLVQCRVTEIETYMDGADLICTTAKVDRSWRHSCGTRHAVCIRRWYRSPATKNPDHPRGVRLCLPKSCGISSIWGQP